MMTATTHTHHCPRCNEDKDDAIDRPEDTICADCWDDGVVTEVEDAAESDHGHVSCGDCVLAENYKEAAYRRLPEDLTATHLLVYECRDCGRKWSCELEGGRNGSDLHRELWGDVELDEILDWFDLN